MEDDLETTFIRRLFLSVILRAVEDAQGKDTMCETPEEEHEAVRSARKFLVTDSDILRETCELAGVEPEEILERYRRLYAGKLK